MIFDRKRSPAHIIPCQTVGWPLFSATGREESPGSRETRCRLTAGGGDPRESATENIPPSPGGPAWDGVGGKGEMVR